MFAVPASNPDPVILLYQRKTNITKSLNDTQFKLSPSGVVPNCEVTVSLED